MKQNFFRKSIATAAGLLCLLNGNLQAMCDLPCLPTCLFYVGTEGLYWTVDQTDLDYAIDVSTTQGHDEVVGPGDVHFLEYDWNGGVRIWVGLQGESCWDVKGVCTYYKNHADASHNGHRETSLLATLVHPATTRCEATSASISNHLRYQTYDLLLSNELSFCCDTFKVNPFFGVRGLLLEQKLKALYEGGDFEDTEVSTPGEVKFSSDLKAVGLHTGMDFNYYLCKGFGLYGGFAGSLLAGNTDSKHKQYLLNEPGNEVEVNTHEKENVIIPGCHLRAGINWASCFDYGSHMLFSIGYEFNEWFNTPRIRRYSDDNCPGVSSDNRGNIGLHGATARLVLFF